MFKKMNVSVRVLFFSLSLLVLTACTPDFNWRELSVADDRVMLAFPSKVQTEKRPVQLADITLEFSLTAASVGPAVFAIGYAALPKDTTVTTEKALIKALLTSLYGQHSQTMTQEALEGKVFELETVVVKQPSWLMARVFVHRGMLIQVVVSGPKKSLPREQALEFMRSLVLK